MSVRDANAQALAAPAAAAPAHHVCRGPGLVDEDEPLRVEIELALEPILPARQDVGAILLAGVRGLFLRVIA
jgi:hypothetical protein